MNCPRCGCCHLASLTTGMIVCPQCDFEIDKETWNNIIEENRKKYNLPDPNNPYTDFAKEMTLLHEALKAEGFKDAMVDILAKMVPIVWDKVQFEEQKDFLHKTLGIDVDGFIAKCNDDNKKPRPENWGGGVMT